jgi:16S rRNA (cytidine1402-2'-O)-methyltransferase
MPQAQGHSLHIAQRIRELMRGGELEEKAALKQAAREFGLSKSEAYRELQRSKSERATRN